MMLRGVLMSVVKDPGRNRLVLCIDDLKEQGDVRDLLGEPVSVSIVQFVDVAPPTEGEE